MMADRYEERIFGIEPVVLRPNQSAVLSVRIDPSAAPLSFQLLRLILNSSFWDFGIILDGPRLDGSPLQLDTYASHRVFTFAGVQCARPGQTVTFEVANSGSGDLRVSAGLIVCVSTMPDPQIGRSQFVTIDSSGSPSFDVVDSVPVSDIAGPFYRRLR